MFSFKLQVLICCIFCADVAAAAAAAASRWPCLMFGVSSVYCCISFVLCVLMVFFPTLHSVDFI